METPTNPDKPISVDSTIEQQPQPVLKEKRKLFLPILLIVLSIASLTISGLIIMKTFSTQSLPVNSPTPTTPTAEDKILGFQITVCCSCPTKILSSEINTNGWVIYEEGKDYSSLLPENCQDVACQPCPPPEEQKQTKINCSDPRPEVCTMECTQPPPYICGSDGKSYCSVCQACSNMDVIWYEIKASACGKGLLDSDFSQGWYWGSYSQKIPGTPSDWIFSGNGSRNDCWHDPDTQCAFLPD